MMRHIVLVMMIFTTLAMADIKNDTQIIDEIFSHLNKKRVGLKERDILTIKNPFIFPNISNQEKTDNNHYTLKATLNDRAYINNTWVKLHGKIGAYKLLRIEKNSVVLGQNSEIKKLYMKSSKNVSIVSQ